MNTENAAVTLIIGQGLAGTAMAWTLIERGRRVLIVDRDEPVTSSKIAAGLLTPITGMRLSLSTGYEEQLAAAVSFYRRIEGALGCRLLHAKRHVRLFKNEIEPGRWDARKQEMKRFLSARQRLVSEEYFHNPRGGFEMKHGGYLDTVSYLSRTRKWFEEQGMMQSGNVAIDEVQPDATGVSWRGQRFREVIYCIGWEAGNHPWFDWVPFQSARGTIVRLRADIGDEDRIIHHGVWLLRHADGYLRAGSTYDTRFGNPNEVPTGDLAVLEQRINQALVKPFEILDARAAVRPIIRDQRMILGRHPAHEHVIFFNGLASKGTLRAPWHAQILAEHLMSGISLPETMDLRGNL